MLKKQIQSAHKNKTVNRTEKQRNNALYSCVNETCVEFFHFDIVITICAIVHPLFELGGSWQRWGFDSQPFSIFVFLYFRK